MNNTLKTILLGALGGAVVLLLAVGFGVNRQLGGLIHNVQESFDEGIAVDGTERISGTGGVSFTTGSFSSTLEATGNTTLAGTLAVQQTASSTVYIGATLKAGCIVIGDSANGANVVYITASGTTITAATTTKPAACR